MLLGYPIDFLHLLTPRAHLDNSPYSTYNGNILRV
jgi:hypothetical protein